MAARSSLWKVAVGVITAALLAVISPAVPGEKTLAIEAEPSSNARERCRDFNWPYIPPNCLNLIPPLEGQRVPQRVLSADGRVRELAYRPITRERIRNKIVELEEREQDLRQTSQERTVTIQRPTISTEVVVVRDGERTSYQVRAE